jgi:hypothetical protein
MSSSPEWTATQQYAHWGGRFQGERAGGRRPLHSVPASLANGPHRLIGRVAKDARSLFLSGIAQVCYDLPFGGDCSSASPSHPIPHY